MNRRVPLLVLGLLIGSAALVTPAEALAPSNSDWVRNLVTGTDTEPVDSISSAGATGKVGIAYHRATSNDVAFALGNQSAGFVVKTLDIQAADATIFDAQLLKISETEWLIIARTAAITFKTYHSTDSGSTWTATATRTSTATGLQVATQNYGATVYASWARQAGAPTTRLERSTDGGVTWTIARDYSPASYPLTGDMFYAPDLLGKAYVAQVIATGTSTSPGSVSESSSEDGSFWNAFAAYTGPFSSGVSVQLVHGTPGPWPIYANCFTSCSVTPQYRPAYAYPTGNLMYTQQLLSATNSYLTNGVDDAASDGTRVVVLQKPLSGAPIVWYSDTTTSALSTLTTPIPAMYLGAGNAVMQKSRLYVPMSNGAVGGRLEVWSAPFSVAPSSSYATRTFTGKIIEGYDVDPFGSSVILRMQDSTGADRHQWIYSVDSSTLGDRVSPMANGCGARTGSNTPNEANIREDGVFSYSEAYPGGSGRDYASYLDCTTSEREDGNFWRLRSGNLGNPNVAGTICDNDNFCDFDIDAPFNSGGCNGDTNRDMPTRALEIQSIESIPISYTRDGDGGINHYTVGFAFNDVSTGDVGVWAITHQFGESDTGGTECKKSVPFSAPAQTYEICSWSNLNETGDNDYLAAVGTSSTTRVWKVTIDASHGGELFGKAPRITMQAQVSPNSPYDHAVGIDCTSGSDAIIGASNGHVNKVRLIAGDATATTGSFIWPADVVVSAATQRNVAISRSGTCAAIYDGPATNHVFVVNGTSGAILETITLATGSYLGMKIDDAGNGLWTFQNNGNDGLATRYDVTAICDSLPNGVREDDLCILQDEIVPCSSINEPPPGSGNGCTSFLCVDDTTVPEGFTVGLFNLFLGVILMLSIAVGIYFTTKSPLMGGVGAVGGFLIGFAFGLFPLWVIVALVIISVAVIFVKSYGAVRGG